jgi:hypothetical protein
MRLEWMMYEMTVNDRIKARSNTRKSVRVAESESSAEFIYGVIQVSITVNWSILLSSARKELAVWWVVSVKYKMFRERTSKVTEFGPGYGWNITMDKKMVQIVECYSAKWSVSEEWRKLFKE